MFKIFYKINEKFLVIKTNIALKNKYTVLIQNNI